MTTNLCRDAEDSQNERWTAPSYDAAGESRYFEKIVKQRPLNLFLIRKRFGGLYWLIDVIKMITSIQKNALANESP